ncbi:unnamed protein product [Candidula unifasciata]|uniref:G-protein coupled receptors family 1 profile domain-containing protein n=1 Tax=Candidula unifasciata TaxID=100452 RepID=A0A8S4A7V5_9EUPU|nr:unnamed protein product [Candidula unifasciata]
MAESTDLSLFNVNSKQQMTVWENGTGVEQVQSTDAWFNINTTTPETHIQGLAASLPIIVVLSVLFFIIVVVGIVGNCLVVVVIVKDVKMRQSVTNLLIINLALADLTIMLLGIPEIILFMVNRGWLLGSVACHVNRFIMVASLYSSVISLAVLCIERFIGIVFPLKVNELCTRKKTIISIIIIWTVSIFCGLPVAIFNQTVPTAPNIKHCLTVFPDNNLSQLYIIYKYSESVLFYYLPMVIQIILYSIIAKRLYASNDELSNQFKMRSTCNRRYDSISDTMKARRGVVKMLIASVLLYFISYSPIQVHIIYSTFARSSFLESWDFFVFVMIVTHTNSAANPLLYAIFSQNFRRHFIRCLCSCCSRHQYARTRLDSQDSRHISTRSSTTSKTYVSRL